MSDIDKAKEILSSEPDLTAVAVRGDTILKTDERGVRPLVRWLDEQDLNGFSAADKTGGLAAAMLYRLLGVSELYFEMASRLCVDYLDSNGIMAACGTLVEQIMNADRSGQCPMEKLATEAGDPAELLKAIKSRMTGK